jgi:hypothetical protein
VDFFRNTVSQVLSRCRSLSVNRLTPLVCTRVYMNFFLARAGARSVVLLSFGTVAYLLGSWYWLYLLMYCNHTTSSVNSRAPEGGGGRLRRKSCCLQYCSLHFFHSIAFWRRRNNASFFGAISFFPRHFSLPSRPRASRATPTAFRRHTHRATPQHPRYLS